MISILLFFLAAELLFFDKIIITGNPTLPDFQKSFSKSTIFFIKQEFKICLLILEKYMPTRKLSGMISPMHTFCLLNLIANSMNSAYVLILYSAEFENCE